jgi:hypothetical protein
MLNKMSAPNLSLIFGLTLMSSEPDLQQQTSMHDTQRYAESQLQVIVIQTILENYAGIFEDE